MCWYTQYNTYNRLAGRGATDEAGKAATAAAIQALEIHLKLSAIIEYLFTYTIQGESGWVGGWVCCAYVGGWQGLCLCVYVCALCVMSIHTVSKYIEVEIIMRITQSQLRHTPRHFSFLALLRFLSLLHPLRLSLSVSLTLPPCPLLPSRLVYPTESSSPTRSPSLDPC